MNFTIRHIDNPELGKNLKAKIDNKTKPLGALGTLEDIALQIGMIQETTSPKLITPTIIVFAGDHGIAKKGEVNPYPQEVTAQMVYNFIQKGAAINVFCQQHQIALKIVDAGVNHNFENLPELIHAKIDFGTQNYEETKAMSEDQAQLAIQRGSEIVEHTHTSGCNTIGFGEMGIGNTSAAALLMAYCTGLSIEECTGAGTGLTSEKIAKKVAVLNTVFEKHQPSDPLDALCCFGGFEIAMIVGALLKAAELKMTILVDGFIVTAAVLVAHQLYPTILDYCVFSHTSGEQGHQKMLDFLGKKPLVHLGMRLGEGTGVAIAYPIVASSVAFLNQMASFEEANISKT